MLLYLRPFRGCILPVRGFAGRRRIEHRGPQQAFNDRTACVVTAFEALPTAHVLADANILLRHNLPVFEDVEAYNSGVAGCF
jgi:hypothetical protein